MTHHTAISLPRQRSTPAIPHPLTTLHPRDNPRGPVRSLYLHVPFCFHKCHYCDFYSIVDSRDRQAAFTERLITELQALAPWAGPLRTVFVGGGTPSLLRPELWERLLHALQTGFDIEPDAEFTVECNPETVTPELLGILRRGGVNRVSIGAQSFDPSHLKTLERWHNPENVARALDAAGAAGIRRRSIDLIFGVPGQTLDDWRRDLAHALSLGLTHLSCYNLTYEPGTAMTARLRRGEFTPAPEDLEVAMYEETLRATREAGLARYEVSNYARPGEECAHNLAYWRQEQWLAAGPSASAHVAGHRWKNVARLDDYLHRSSGLAPIGDHEPPDARRALREEVMTRLRLGEGLRVEDLVSALRLALGDACAGIAARLRSIAASYEAAGQLSTDSGVWRLTDAGFLVADRIAADLMHAIGGE